MHVCTLFARYFHCALQALCQRSPYLPRAGDAPPAALSTAPPEALLLDRQFRLLREDVVGPLREELTALGLAGAEGGLGVVQVQGQGKAGISSVGGSTAAAALPARARNTFPVAEVVAVSLQPRPCVVLRVALPPTHRALHLGSEEERLAYWREGDRGTLALDALVCIACPGQEQPLAFGTVVRREPREMADPAGPCVGVALESQKDLERLVQLVGRGRQQGMVLVQVRCLLACTSHASLHQGAVVEICSSGLQLHSCNCCMLLHECTVPVTSSGKHIFIHTLCSYVPVCLWLLCILSLCLSHLLSIRSHVHSKLLLLTHWPTTYTPAQVSANMLSTRPVLKCLQEMGDVPMAEELVHGAPHPHPVSYIPPETTQQVDARTEGNSYGVLAFDSVDMCRAADCARGALLLLRIQLLARITVVMREAVFLATTLCCLLSWKNPDACLTLRLSGPELAALNALFVPCCSEQLLCCTACRCWPNWSLSWTPASWRLCACHSHHASH